MVLHKLDVLEATAYGKTHTPLDGSERKSILRLRATEQEFHMLDCPKLPSGKIPTYSCSNYQTFH